MSIYTISPCLLQKSDEANVIKIILSFITNETLKIALDDKSLALDKYSKVLNDKYTSTLACWLDNITIFRKYESIKIDNIGVDDDIFLEICRNTFGSKHNMLVGSKQNFKGYPIISNHSISYKEDEIYLYDPEEAISFINNKLYIENVKDSCITESGNIINKGYEY